MQRREKGQERKGPVIEFEELELGQVCEFWPVLGVRSRNVQRRMRERERMEDHCLMEGVPRTSVIMLICSSSFCPVKRGLQLISSAITHPTPLFQAREKGGLSERDQKREAI